MQLSRKWAAIQQPEVYLKMGCPILFNILKQPQNGAPSITTPHSQDVPALSFGALFGAYANLANTVLGLGWTRPCAEWPCAFFGDIAP